MSQSRAKFGGICKIAFSTNNKSCQPLICFVFATKHDRKLPDHTWEMVGDFLYCSCCKSPFGNIIKTEPRISNGYRRPSPARAPKPRNPLKNQMAFVFKD